MVATLSAFMANSPRKVTDHLVAWTAGNGNPMHEVCIPHSKISRMGTARVKQEHADTRIIIYKYGRKKRARRGKIPNKA